MKAADGYVADYGKFKAEVELDDDDLLLLFLQHSIPVEVAGVLTVTEKYLLLRMECQALVAISRAEYEGADKAGQAKAAAPYRDGQQAVLTVIRARLGLPVPVKPGG